MKPCGPALSGPALPAWIDTAMPVKTSTMIGITSAPNPANFTSRAWIFFPRYSGVRPIMRPPMNTAMTAYIKMVYMPLPVPPGVTSPSIIPVIRPKPPIGVNES